ncbi:hypothetical protein AAEU31_17160 [Pseudoalteromonas sp. SSMSWG5]|uniref:hypothetical protein n=1 Tax=Pseudoalteromonas sp. SSMSWG5 TaxID=3139396 RepID=UPI003BACC94F
MILFQFKGDRNYLHGTDTFDKISELLTNEFITDISFRKTTVKQCVISDLKISNVVSVIKTNIRTYYLCESDENITERYDFDEDALVSNAIIDDKVVSMNMDSNYSFIENIVALTKLLNNNLDKPKYGKWLFGQYRSQIDNRNFSGKIEIESVKRIAGKFSENLIYLDGKLAGKIMFIVGQV